MNDRFLHRISRPHLWFLGFISVGLFSVGISFSSATSQNSDDPTVAGLVGGYSFDEGMGTTAGDASGNGNNGMLQLGPTWTTGYYGNALDFNGFQFVDLGNPAAFHLTGSMTVSAWVRASADPPDDGNIVAKSDFTSGWQFKTSTDTGPQTFAIAVNIAPNSWVQRNTNTVRALGVWYNVAAVYDAAAGTLDMYVNGMLDNGILSGSVPASQIDAPVDAYVGARFNGFDFIGTIDEVRIYNRALNQNEIVTDMNTPLGGGPTPSPTATPSTSTPTPTPKPGTPTPKPGTPTPTPKPPTPTPKPPTPTPTPVPTPAQCMSCASSNFNGTAIGTNRFIWFTANMKASHIPSTGATILFNNSVITINSHDGVFSYPTRPGRIIFSPSETCSKTTFDGTQWVTTVPVNGSDEVLLSAFGLHPTAELKGAHVTWCANFTTDASGVQVSWKYGAAVYTSDMTEPNYNAVGVKPTHTNSCLYSNSDHAGTPENRKGFVVGGAQGGGGSNWTGSWSSTSSTPVCVKQ